jgi:hypothetical protein
MPVETSFRDPSRSGFPCSKSGGGCFARAGWTLQAQAKRLGDLGQLIAGDVPIAPVGLHGFAPLDQRFKFTWHIGKGDQVDRDHRKTTLMEGMIHLMTCHTT